MTTAVANSDEFALKRFLVYSLSLHGVLALALAISAFVKWHNGEQWSGTGSIGNAQNVTLVSNSGIALPQPKEPTESKTVDPTMSINKEDLIKPPEPKTDATPIQKFKIEKPLPPSKKSKTMDDKTPPPPNAIPGQSSGPPKIQSGMGEAPGSSASGVNLNGQAGGQFSSRYPWYIAAAKRRVAPNWDSLSIDAAVRNSQTLHCVISFTILRDGTVKNPRVTQSSGNLSWDNSGLRAIMASSPFAPLPSDWPGQDVSVLWDFPDQPSR
jgi:TonB family protein